MPSTPDRPCKYRMPPADILRATRTAREYQLFCRCWLLCRLLNFLQCRNTSLTDRWVALGFTNTRRIVPAALAFLTVRAGDRDGDTVPSTPKLHVRHDEQIPQITLMPLKQFKRTAGRLQRHLRLQRAPNLLRDARFLQRTQNIVANRKQPFPLGQQLLVTFFRRLRQQRQMDRRLPAARQVFPDLV